jgi:hypothetical protein
VELYQESVGYLLVDSVPIFRPEAPELGGRARWVLAIALETRRQALLKSRGTHHAAAGLTAGNALRSGQSCAAAILRARAQ